MACLSVRLLGPLMITLGGESVTGFASDKVRALLAYLAVETEWPHRREKLAGLLWPECREQSARTNLRSALASVRQVIRDNEAIPPFLHVTRKTLQFNEASDAWVDVKAFTNLIAHLPPGGPKIQQTIDALEEAVALYRGEFLEGFSLPDSQPFEEWTLLQRGQSQRLLIEALHRLAESHAEVGEYERGLPHAWRQVALDPWREKAHRQLMRLLALNGQRGAALAQYESCRSLLAEELGVEPGEETTKLYEQIRDGMFSRGGEKWRSRGAVAAAPAAPRPIPAARLPSFLDKEAAVEVERPVFVAREDELAQLDRFLDMALAGQGRVVFVIGEAGSGKTALIQECSWRAQEAHAGLIAAGGNCNAYTGIGDPYLPFREILALLTGDVAARWAARSIGREQARRLWDALPLTAQALVGGGSDLIDTFVPAGPLLERAMAYKEWSRRPAWLTRLDELSEHKQTGLGPPSPQQNAIFEQYMGVLQSLALQAPLVLTLDDLQWADAGSIGFLFHLGRRLAGTRILVVGTYRGEEVAIGRAGERHPLEPVVNEFQRLFGDITVDLAQAGSRPFVEAFLDSEPNRLSSRFRGLLHRQTRGHPLFTIELLRGLQERGDLIQDPEGRWIEGQALDWGRLPARVEAVIAERIGRLPQPLQSALRVASVEGEVFTAEVVARVRAAAEGEMVERLSDELERRHRLVRAEGILRIDGQRLSRYRFRHILFQRYLYNSLDEVERVQLHEAVGDTLEALYADQSEPLVAIAGQLARHFQEAGIAQKAIGYLQLAGERAVQLSAFQEAIAHLSRGLALLKALPDPGDEAQRRERAEQELALQLALGAAWVSRAGYGLQGEQHYTRARELSEQLGETSQLCVALGRLSTFYCVRSEYERARELAEEAIGLAEVSGDLLHIALGHYYLGSILLHLGEFAAARTHFEQMIAFYDPQQHHDVLVALRGSDAGTTALALRACCLWCLGYPDQALKQSREALALAHELGHPWSLAGVLCYAGCMVSEMSRDAEQLEDAAEEITQLAIEKVTGWSGAGPLFRGAALAIRGQADLAIAQLDTAKATFESMGFSYYSSGRLRFLAEAQAQAGHVDQGLATLSQALTFVRDTNECQVEAELHRLRGELLLAHGDQAKAEASFHRAIDIARRQRAKSWELRATTSLCRLWQQQGKREEARQRLAGIYDWFTEGFDTPDLKEARALLEELSS